MVMSASEKTKFINTFCEMLSEFIKTPEEIEKAKAEIELKNDTEMLTIKECSVIMRVSERTIRMLVKQNAIGSTKSRLRFLWKAAYSTKRVTQIHRHIIAGLKKFIKICEKA